MDGHVHAAAFSAADLECIAWLNRLVEQQPNLLLEISRRVDTHRVLVAKGREFSIEVMEYVVHQHKLSGALSSGAASSSSSSAPALLVAPELPQPAPSTRSLKLLPDLDKEAVSELDMEAVPNDGDFCDLDKDSVPDVGDVSDLDIEAMPDVGEFSDLDVGAVPDVGGFSDLDMEVVPNGAFEDLDQPVLRSKAVVPLPPGIERFSVAWGRALSQRHWEAAKTESPYNTGLAKGFNLFPLRVGDHVPLETPTSTCWTHGNNYSARGLLKLSYSEIGKGLRNHTGAQGIDNCRRRAEALCTVASIQQRIYLRKSSEVKSQVLASKPAGLVFFDIATALRST